MIKAYNRRAEQKRIHRRIRRRVSGTGDRPRLTIYRGLHNIYAQAIDDTASKTLASASTLEKDGRKAFKGMANAKAAEWVGGRIAERLMQAGIDQVVFDRSGYRYLGRVKVLADAARKKGLKF